MKLETKCPRWWEQQVRKDVLQEEGRAWEGTVEESEEEEEEEGGRTSKRQK
jgi:hypothetical protein